MTRKYEGPYTLTRYTEDQRQALLDLVTCGETQNAACAQLGIPLQTAINWQRHDEEYAAQWRLARIAQAHSLADQALQIANEPVGESMAAVQRNRLRVDTIKWLTSKIAPKLYGERVMQDHTHRVGIVMLPPVEPKKELASPIQTVEP